MKITITSTGVLAAAAATVFIAFFGYVTYQFLSAADTVTEPASNRPLTSQFWQFSNRPPLALAATRPFLSRWPRRAPFDRTPLLNAPDAAAVPAFLLPEPSIHGIPQLARVPLEDTPPQEHQVRVLDDDEEAEFLAIEDTIKLPEPNDAEPQTEKIVTIQAVSTPAVSAFYDENQYFQQNVQPSATETAQNAGTQFQLRQEGELNSISLLMLGENNYMNIQQRGSANIVSGFGGDSAFQMSGNNGTVQLLQNGNFNQVYGLQQSHNSVIRVQQAGHGNVANISQR